jgi:hypothetical protein
MLPSESLMDASTGFCAGSDNHGRNEKGSFYLIPLGISVAGGPPTGPLIMFPNDSDEKCLHRSFASALHFLGYKSQALSLLNPTNLSSSASSDDQTPKQMQCRQFEAFKQSVLGCKSKNLSLFNPTNHGSSDAQTPKQRQCHQFKAFKQSVLGCMSMYDKVRYRKARCGKADRYDPTNPEHQNNNPIAASLKAARMVGGKKVSVQINHAVCFLGSYTFDSNQERALVTCKESLDRVCSSVSPGSFYDGLYWERELVLDKKTVRN